MTRETLNLDALRARLNGGGRTFWRSLEELAETPEFQELLAREFPRGAAELRDPMQRRTFLKLMGASLALGGLTACQFDWKQPQEKIVPYVRQPEEVIPGRPLYYATAMTMGGYATGVLVESHEGRPTKVEGNPDHPASLGSTDAITQASILTMYDPGRSTTVLNAGQARTWADFLAALGPALDAQRGAQGAGLRILTGTVTSPTLAAQIQALLQGFPQARWYQYEPVGRGNTNEGARLAFGTDVNTIYRFERANVVVALDSDFLMEPGTGVRYARDFAQRRRVRRGQAAMSRVYAVEPTLSNTGMMADHRLRAKAGRVEAIARALAAAVGVVGATAEGLSEEEQRWVNAAARDLQAARGAGIVIPGPYQPAAVHALAHALNGVLGNVGQTVVYTAPVETDPAGGIGALQALAQELGGGAVQLLVMMGVNPVYDAPGDIDFAALLRQVPFSVHLGLYADETAAASTWHVNEAHYLETWGDARAFDGTVTIQQPLIAPLYDGKSPIDLINALAGSAQTTYQALQAYWQGQGLPGDFGQTWQRILHDGVVPDTAAAPRGVVLSATLPPASPAPAEGLEIVFRPDPLLYDGAFANNGWLQETPKPFTKLVWDNAALVSPATAERLGVTNGDVVMLEYQGRSVEAPIWILFGQAEDVVTVHLGYGRNVAGTVPQPGGGIVGFNAYRLRSIATPWFGSGLNITRTGRRYELVSTQGHFTMEGREEDLVRHGTLADFAGNEEFIHHGEHHEVISLFPEYKYHGYAWGMSIDTNVCIGCGACAVACQAENNIPVVGKAEVSRGREMQWLRIDYYYTGELDNPQVYNMVVLCQHCENAPCEIVCPVAATVHDSEGINTMVYNRCVGTKYCSNNCPYKVRRFNFLQYADETTPSLKLGRNPDVTVRARGVMEKCTFCIQRINEARIDTERQGTRISDGMIQTACQQACPTQAIVFGDINDPNSAVTRLKQEPLTYTSLDSLNTRPRVSYMATLKNLSPDMPATRAAEE
ncbi:MAG TPA: TAT-variant-translocated molybdopterin oxidoreductase [Roseiflexaceae bacterium]|nr:TAT-variant-translocated molybdopterin oxidoreductase [Roseiflexaceae bacterium]